MEEIASLPLAGKPEYTAVSVSLLARKHHDQLLRFLRTRIRGASVEAADIAQEAYIRMMQYEGSGQIRSPYHLLLRVALNVAQDLRRAERVRHVTRHHSIDDVEIASEAPGPDHALSHAEDLNLALRAIESLPPRCREVFLLHRRGELSYPQIARHCGISVKTVEKHIRTALSSCEREMAR
jgi:RNA polymerase sigma factor (sigma-70 family)